MIKAVRELSEKCETLSVKFNAVEQTTKNNLSFSLTLSDVGCIASKKHNLDKKKIKGYDVMVEMKDGSLIKNGACGITFDAFITADSLYIKTISNEIANCVSKWIIYQ